MSKPTGMIIVGTKPPRPHFVADQLRVEIWSGPNGDKVPVMRMRNEQCGTIAVLTHEELVNHRNAVDSILQTLESGAAVAAKGLLDGIIAKAKNQPKPEEGTSDE